ncbi:unnamed protein product, partial [Rotaria magnacalcarata]
MAEKGDEKDQAIIDLTQRMMKMMDDFNLASSNKVHFKALKPGVYSIDDTISLEDFLSKFEKYCAVKFGLGDEDSWSSALGELLAGEIKNAYTNMSGRCNLPGHFANVCPNARVAIAPPQGAGTVAIPNQIVSPPQSLNGNLLCVGCGKSGVEFHLLPKCPVMIAWWGNAPTVRANSSRVAAIEEAGTNANKNNINPLAIDDRLFIDCMIEGKVYRGLVDSGAQVCLIAKETVLKNHDSARIKKCNVEIVGIGGGVNVIGEIILMMQVAKDIHMDQTFIVVENLSTQLLLGANFLIKNRLVLDLANKKVVQEQPIKINPANGVNLNCDYKEVKLVENIDLKPQSSTVVAYKLDADFLNNKSVTNIGIFSDEANLDKNLLVASFIID